MTNVVRVTLQGGEKEGRPAEGEGGQAEGGDPANGQGRLPGMKELICAAKNPGAPGNMD